MPSNFYRALCLAVAGSILFGTGVYQSGAALAAENKNETIANDAFWQRDYHSARAAVLKRMQESDLSTAEQARCLVNLAICDTQLDDWTEARKNSAAALKIAHNQSLTAADATTIQARCLLLAGQAKKPKCLYKRAIAIVSSLQGAWSPDLGPIYEGLAGCYVREKNYQQAEIEYKKVSQLDLLKYGPDDAHFAWSLLSLGAAEKHLHNDDLARDFYRKVFWNFRRQNQLRILAEHKDDPDQDRLAAHLQLEAFGDTGAYNNREMGLAYVREGIPATAYEKPFIREKTFANWFKERVGRERAPGLALFDPNVPLKAIIVTVHGLGLHGGAFTPFAEKVQHDGFGVVSFDVRGFGSYRNDEVFQQLNLQASVADIKRILISLRADYSHTPLILLGESMGGAIVLRVAAEAPELVDAVISSVPSGSRYHQKKIDFKVGLKFLNHKHSQFDVGTGIVEQATDKGDLRDMWEGDPKVRLKLSASELVNFQKFMGENIKAVAKITRTPVIIYQGYSDNLVKPMGTLAIYQAIPNKDKDMIFIGRAKHLIFEEGQTDPIVLHNIVEWMTRHLPASAKPL